MKDEKTKIHTLLEGSTELDFRLINTHTKEFYGFHCNYPLTYRSFCEFTLENEEEVERVIDNSDFSKEELEKLFFDTFTKSLFEAVKKRFAIQTVIERFKDLVGRIKREYIWIPSEEQNPMKMNATFVLMYLLNNADHQLRVELMNLVKTAMPLPMLFREFDSILKVSNELTLNDDLVWIMKRGITICSIGAHNKEFLKS